MKSLLLASTALLALTALQPAAQAQTQLPLVLAQSATPPAAAPAPDDKKKPERKAPPPAAKPAAPPPPPPPAAKPAPPPPPPPAPPAAQQQPPRPPAAAPERRPEPPPQAGERREQRQERREERRNNPPPAPAAKPAEAPPAAQQQQQPKPPAPAVQQPPAAAPQPQRPPEQRQDRRNERRDERRQQQPAAAPSQPPSPPAASQPPAPAPAAPPQSSQSAPPSPQQSAPAARPPAQPPAQAGRPGNAPPQATQPRDARDFIRRDNAPPSRGMDDVRNERRETREGSRTVIREGDRTIVRQNNRVIIQHSETQRFAVGARGVNVERRGNQTVTAIARPNGMTIVSTTGADGRLIRRARRDANGREIVIIDNSLAGPRSESYFVDLPPPRVRRPGWRYFIDAGRASPAEIFDIFLSPPIERLDRRYTVDQVRYSDPLRMRMPRVDLDVNFETGSWQLTPEQVDQLSVIAEALNRAIERNPREVFLIEGHTDAVGTDDDNLSLSDRRAESVAVALTEQFQVPPENLVTQGYGEQYLKEPTGGPSRVNRRVAVRRITPLIAQSAR